MRFTAEISRTEPRDKAFSPVFGWLEASVEDTAAGAGTHPDPNQDTSAVSFLTHGEVIEIWRERHSGNRSLSVSFRLER